MAGAQEVLIEGEAGGVEAEPGGEVPVAGGDADHAAHQAKAVGRDAGLHGEVAIVIKGAAGKHGEQQWSDGAGVVFGRHGSFGVKVEALGSLGCGAGESAFDGAAGGGVLRKLHLLKGEAQFSVAAQRARGFGGGDVTDQDGALRHYKLLVFIQDWLDHQRPHRIAGPGRGRAQSRGEQSVNRPRFRSARRLGRGEGVFGLDRLVREGERSGQLKGPGSVRGDAFRVVGKLVVEHLFRAITEPGVSEEGELLMEASLGLRPFPGHERLPGARSGSGQAQHGGPGGCAAGGDGPGAVRKDHLVELDLGIVEGSEVSQQAAVPALLRVRCKGRYGASDPSVFRDNQFSMDVERIDEAALDGFAGFHGVGAEAFDLKAGPGGQYRRTGKRAAGRRRFDGRGRGLCRRPVFQRLRGNSDRRQKRGGAEQRGALRRFRKQHEEGATSRPESVVKTPKPGKRKPERCFRRRLPARAARPLRGLMRRVLPAVPHVASRPGEVRLLPRRTSRWVPECNGALGSIARIPGGGWLP